MFQESMTFKDVAVDITQEDWELMRPVQKELYKTVTLQNYWNMVSLGERLFVPPNHTHARVCLSSALKSGLGLEVNMLICSGTETANFCSLFPDERFQSERSSGSTMHGPPRPPPHALPGACLPHSLCTPSSRVVGDFCPCSKRAVTSFMRSCLNRSFPVRGLSSWVRRSQLIKVE